MEILKTKEGPTGALLALYQRQEIDEQTLGQTA